MIVLKLTPDYYEDIPRIIRAAESKPSQEVREYRRGSGSPQYKVLMIAETID
jgi:hypothetical protein